MTDNNYQNLLEESLLSALLNIRQTIQTESREVMANVDGLSALMAPEDVSRFKVDAETCLMMTTQFPLVIDPAHVDEAILRRSAKFLAAQIVTMLIHYNKYAVPHRLTFQFNSQFVGMAHLTWAHHVELTTEVSSP